MSMCYVNSLWHCVYVSWSTRNGLCVRVGNAVATRDETDWMSLFIRFWLALWFGIRVPSGSHKWQVVFPNWQAGMINRIEFRVWSSLVVRWSMKIIWWYQGDVVCKSRARHWTRYCDVLRWDPQSISDAPAAEEPLRNRTIRSTSAKFETRKIKSTWYQLLKHQKLLKNSSWAQSYDDLKKVRFFFNT